MFIVYDIKLYDFFIYKNIVFVVKKGFSLKFYVLVKTKNMFICHKV